MCHSTANLEQPEMTVKSVNVLVSGGSQPQGAPCQQSTDTFNFEAQA